MNTPTQTQGGESVKRFTLASWLSIYGRTSFHEFVKESDYAELERETATLRRERDELRAELLTTHQMACRVGLERDELAKLLETECNTLQVELVEAERKFQDGFDCVPFCELSSAANALLSRIRAALQSATFGREYLPILLSR